MQNNQFVDLVKEDYNDMLSNVNVDVSYEVKRLLLLQSVAGHAMQGHGKFRDRHRKTQYLFPETTVEDVVDALSMSAYDVKEERQGLIDESTDMVARIMGGERVSTYTNRHGDALFRIGMLNYMPIQDPAAFLIGIYLGSRMDNYLTWRKGAEERYGLNIGGGECVGINRAKASERGLSIQDFAIREHTMDDAKWLLDSGMVCKDTVATPDMVHGYLRYAKGKGTSDDLAVILAGKLYGKDAALGVFIADAVDTWDKYTPYIHEAGQDEQLGDRISANVDIIRRSMPQFNLPHDEDVFKFIYTIAEENYTNMISESQRYFLQFGKKTKITPIMSHLKFISNSDDCKTELEEKIKEAKGIKNKKTKRRSIKKLEKKLRAVGEIPEMHIGHPNSKLTNLTIYKKFEEKFKEVYG